MTLSNLITGGAGFIGANLAQRLLQQGERVLIFDNLSRPNVEQNVRWLTQQFGDRAELRVADIRDLCAVREHVRQVDHVFHLAAQVAVTTSLANPLADFDINARGSLHVLEAARTSPRPPSIFFTSTNKVYGDLGRIALSATPRGYLPLAADLREHGVSEDTPLDFHSPYGCSKGTADQYMLDHARCFGLRCVVFRMSCIYGPRQFGAEDQGWVAHFMLRALQRAPVTVYGDGLQTRDLLFVSDLVDAFLAARSRLDVCAGQVFNVGGGPKSFSSVLDLLNRIRRLTGWHLPLQFADWRAGDQRYYSSDTRKLTRSTGWQPKVTIAAGLEQLHQWLSTLVPQPGQAVLSQAWREPWREDLAEGAAQ